MRASSFLFALAGAAVALAVASNAIPVARGIGEKLFTFAANNILGGLTTIAANCPSKAGACAVGAIQTVIAALAGLTSGVAAFYGNWRRDEDGTYHIYINTDPTSTNHARAQPIDWEAFRAQHHSIETHAKVHLHGGVYEGKQFFYHFANATRSHKIFSHLFTPASEGGGALSRREQVGADTGFGLSADETNTEWNGADKDVNGWSNQVYQYLSDNNADSACGTFEASDDGTNDMYFRIQPANNGDYNGIDEKQCENGPFR